MGGGNPLNIRPGGSDLERDVRIVAGLVGVVEPGITYAVLLERVLSLDVHVVDGRTPTICPADVPGVRSNYHSVNSGDVSAELASESDPTDQAGDRGEHEVDHGPAHELHVRAPKDVIRHVRQHPSACGTGAQIVVPSSTERLDQMADIRRITEPADVHAAAALFDERRVSDATERFLSEPGHHLLIAYVGDQPVGFVTGVEMTHPDKGTEMFLYELGVDEAHQRRGIGRALVSALATLARERDCYGMWVLTDDDNAAAMAAYRGAGGVVGETSRLLSWEFSDEGRGEQPGPR